jgi:hypothetical protein
VRPRLRVIERPGRFHAGQTTRIQLTRSPPRTTLPAMPLSDEDRRRIEEEEFRREARARAKRQFDADGASVVRTTAPSGQPPKKTELNIAIWLRRYAIVGFVMAWIGLVVTRNLIAFFGSLGIAAFMLLASLAFKTK